ncbi:MAG: fluoride efflux transporter CrcB [Flavobacteriaceae bacterium]|nr:fluoride efflux transporter CrcB [Flavobacteriaceae bacterium]
MKHALLVFLGGGLGSTLRYLLGKYINSQTAILPWGTFAANILGCFIIGILFGWALKSITFPETTLLFLATGFCGGFTTFSAFAYENQLFLKTGDFTSFFVYTVASILLGLLAVIAGMWLVKVV